MASPVTVPNSFTAGTDAVAAEINANFTSLVDYINDNMVTDDGTVNINGTQVVNNLTVNGTLTTTGNISATVDTLKGNVLSEDGNVIVLENGTDGSDATFRGDVINTAGTVILDVSAATFNGNATTATTVTGSVANADQWTTSRTLTLTGDVSGSVSVQGNANMSMFTTVSGVSSVSTGSTSDSTTYLALLNSAGGTQQIKYDTGLSYNASSNMLISQGTVKANGGNASTPTFAVADNDSGFYGTGGVVSVSIQGTGCHEFNFSAFKPLTNGSKTLGVNGLAWSVVYASNTSIQTSDDRLKVMIDDALGLDFINDLTPFSGVWAEEGYDTCQYEWLSAQNMRATLDAYGRPYDVGIWKVQTEDPDTGEPIADGMQSVSYDGLVPVLVKAIQELTARVEALEAA
jgi:hypothetical protein